MSKKWLIWFVPNWDSIPSSVKAKGHAIIAALQIRMSSPLSPRMDEILVVARRMEDWEARSQRMNCTLTDGCFWLISRITGVTLEAERPVRRRREGEAAARARAVVAPIPPVEGPVMRTLQALEYEDEMGGETYSFCLLPCL